MARATQTPVGAPLALYPPLPTSQTSPTGRLAGPLWPQREPLASPCPTPPRRPTLPTGGLKGALATYAHWPHTDGGPLPGFTPGEGRRGVLPPPARHVRHVRHVMQSTWRGHNLLIYSDLGRAATCAPCPLYFLGHKKKRREGGGGESKGLESAKKIRAYIELAGTWRAWRASPVTY